MRYRELDAALAPALSPRWLTQRPNDGASSSLYQDQVCCFFIQLRVLAFSLTKRITYPITIFVVALKGRICKLS